MPDSNSQVAKRVEHTPGPWRVCSYDREPGNRGIWIFQHVEGNDAYCRRTVVDTTAIDAYPLGDADTALIAAAPAMLRALEAVRNDCVEVLEGRERLSMKLIHAIVNGLPRAAIAKARGQ